MNTVYKLRILYIRCTLSQMNFGPIGRVAIHNSGLVFKEGMTPESHTGVSCNDTGKDDGNDDNTVELKVCDENWEPTW